MFATTDFPLPFQPKPDELRFFSEAEGVRYARDAGFTATNVHGVPVASRMDMPEKTWMLAVDRADPDKFIWVERR